MANISYGQLMENLKGVGFTRTLPVFTMHIDKNGGLLPDDIRASACWYYCTVAHKSLEKVKDGAAFEGEEDPVDSLNNIARSVAAFYKLDSPSEFLKFMGDCRLEALRCNMDWDETIEQPLKHQFVMHQGQGKS